MQDLCRQKAQLRRHFRDLRAQLSPEQRAGANLWLYLQELEQTLKLARNQPRLGFVGVNGELDTLPELERRRARGEHLFIPRCEGQRIRDGVMEFYRFTGADQLVDGPYGLKEPVPHEPLTFEQPPVMWVPGLAFDRQGRRLGQGGGFYDRYLDRPCMRDALRIGLCPDQNVVLDTALPADAKDQRVHWLVTPTQILETAFGERARGSR